MTKRLKYLVGGEWKESTTDEWYPITNSSTGDVMAEAPRCTPAEVDEAVAAAHAAYPAWRDTPITERVQVMFRLKDLLEAELHDLAVILSTEMGKSYAEASEILEFSERGISEEIQLADAQVVPRCLASIRGHIGLGLH